VCLEEDGGLGQAKRVCLKRVLVYSAGTQIRLTTRHGYEFFLTVGRNIEPDGILILGRYRADYMRFFDSRIWKTLEMSGKFVISNMLN
jgi:hypothetical protein